jgi:hypothetical protein
MPERLYDRIETDSAFTALSEIIARLPEPFLLLGGWAVYVTVNQSYSDAHGAGYLGSKDIDVCFRINPRFNDDELRNCTFARALNVIKEIGYAPYGSFRYCKFIRKDTGEAISEDVARQYGMHELFYLYIDVMVDNIHPRHRDIFGCHAIDEPLLQRVFDENSGISVRIDNVTLLIPPPVMLLATKIRSIQTRTKDDKLIKDACDIYAILWHSSDNYRSILDAIHRQYPEDCKKGYTAITEEIAKKASRHLGVELESYQTVIDGLIEM